MSKHRNRLWRATAPNGVLLKEKDVKEIKLHVGARKGSHGMAVI